MNFGRRAFLGSGIALLAATQVNAADWIAATPGDAGPAGDPNAWPPAETVALWPGEPPNRQGALPVPQTQIFSDGGDGAFKQRWNRGVAVPALHVFRPATPNGAALLSLPGGAYEFLAVRNEGNDIAARFNAEGITVFVLSYRLPNEGWAHRSDVPLQDAQRAMRLIRARATHFGIDPGRVGVVGFSAGGHLAATLATCHGETVYATVDSADATSARPDFAALIYPVISMREHVTHPASRDNLLGPNPSEQLIEARSPARRVGKDTSPCFLVHAVDDGAVPVENSIEMAQALRANGVPLELHLFEVGGHGFGVHLPADMPVSRWPELLLAWMKRRR